MIKAIIIDDEKMARVLLNGMLNEFCKNVEVMEQCEDLPSGVKAIKKLNPDLVFLDIEMPNYSGLEILDFFTDTEINFTIIFVTAYNKYAIEAFKLSAFDYILKPIETIELENAVERFTANKNNQNKTLLREQFTNPLKKISIATVSGIKFIDTEDILYIKGDGAYSQIYLKDNSIITTSKNLKHFENSLASNNSFYRCHKSFIINLLYVTEYIKTDGGYLVINKKDKISVSTDKLEELISRLK